MATETTTETGAKDTSSQVRIHLQSRSDDLQLPDTGPILVSTELRRYQLSTLVNRLLETDQPIPLEFLINGQFLRTSLDDFLTQNGISAETLLNVEYVKALIPPLPVASYEHDDWVSSVDVLSPLSRAAQWTGDAAATSASQRILSGSYDGLLRIWNMSSEVVATGTGHNAAVKSARFMSPTQVVSSSVDRTLRVWKYEDSSTGGSALTPTLELYGHQASVDDLDVHAPTSRFLSASSDHTISLWSSKKSDAPAAPEHLLPTANTTGNKRRKLSTAKASPQRGPLATFHSHSAQASAVRFDATDPTIAYSTSWDHTLKTWDLPTSTCVATLPTSSALLSLCHLPSASLLAAGTAGRAVALLDPRASATSIAALTLRGHTNSVVSLARDPSSEHRLVSGAHDGTCRVWDIRSVRREGSGERVGESVYVMEREGAEKGAKVFGVDWDPEVGIVSGGEDRKVQVNRGER